MEYNDREIEKPELELVNSDDEKGLRHEVVVHRNWPMLIILTLAAIAFAVLVFFTGRWIYDKLHHTNTNNPPPAPTATVTPSTPSSVSGSGVPSSPTNANSSSSSSTKNSQIANSGPGDVVAIFAASALVATCLHYVIGTRKQV